jgi:hypothetical protein
VGFGNFGKARKIKRGFIETTQIIKKLIHILVVNWDET